MVRRKKTYGGKAMSLITVQVPKRKKCRQVLERYGFDAVRTHGDTAEVRIQDHLITRVRKSLPSGVELVVLEKKKS